jgi:hypothetical protein
MTLELPVEFRPGWIMTKAGAAVWPATDTISTKLA